MDLLTTRSRLHKALCQLREEEDEGVDAAEAIDRRLEVLGRARKEAEAEWKRTGTPRTTLEHVESIMNSMCDPEGAPLLEEIDACIVNLTHLKSEALKSRPAQPVAKTGAADFLLLGRSRNAAVPGVLQFLATPPGAKKTSETSCRVSPRAA